MWILCKKNTEMPFSQIAFFRKCILIDYFYSATKNIFDNYFSWVTEINSADTKRARFLARFSQTQKSVSAEFPFVTPKSEQRKIIYRT